MIGPLLYIVLFTTLTVIFIQDLKYRAVSIVAFPVLLISIICFAIWSNNSLTDLWNNAAFNMLFLILQYALLTIYFSIKHRQFINITKSYLGLGDVLFLVCCTGVFSPINFVVFYLLSTIVVILIHIVSQFFVKINPKIPLAGMQALTLIIVLVTFQFFINGNLYDDTWLLSYYV